MSVLKECSRLARITSRSRRFPSIIQQTRPISIVRSHRLICRKIANPEKLLAVKYAQWNPNIVKSPFPDTPLPKTTFTDHLWSWIDRWHNHTALVCGVTRREVTYKELRNECRKFGVALLKDLGVKPGQVIATILPNIIQHPPVMFGAIEAGVIVTPVNPAYKADEIAYQLKDSGAVLAVTYPDKLETLKEIKEKFDFPDLQIVLTPGMEDPYPEGVKSYDELVSNADPDLLYDLKPKKFSGEDTIVIPYSSGTTGQPKGVCLSNNNIIANLVAMHAVKDIEVSSGNFQEVLPVILPIFHIYGFVIVLCQALSLGAKLIMMPKFEETKFLNALKDYGATVLYVAPPLLLYIGNSTNTTTDHLKSVRLIINGAAPVGESDIQKCLQKFSEDVFYKQGYGLTETAPVVCNMIKGKKLYASVGPPVANTSVKIMDIQTKQALGNNEEGEICVKGPQVMKGYLNRQKETDEVLDKDGWLHTGDVGYYDEEGFVYITDRLKELIKVKGFQVPPAELESVLRSHPDVEDAGVIGVPHDKYGETPVGFVQLKAGGKADSNVLKRFLKQKLASFKQIHNFVFVDAIPKSASGKILRRELRSHYQKN
ncbi:4-coumarate--CoA ligase-like [Cimex lectularius]|uniref:Luciferin 4-monooxygenase n=1 Tax=Cimex lectularius TaxID=79782 RepID=A0A8I6R9Q4_CIMLE|nr:4-coumarate--CoA ligase-like [Cimex lectularius]